MPWQALVCDIDGTLRTDAPPRPAVVQVLAAARARGVRVLVATARRQASAARALGELAWMAESGIFHNGAVIRCARTSLARQHCVPSAAARSLVAMVHALAPDVRIAVHGPDHGAAMGGDDGWARRRDPTAVAADPSAFMAALEQPICKIAVTADRDLHALAKDLARQWPAFVHQCGDGGTMIQVMAAGVAKERALETLLQAHSCAWRGTIVVGDDVGDAGMIARAGLGIAIAEGHAAARSAAHEVVAGPPSDALAQRLEALLLADAPAAPTPLTGAAGGG